MDETLPQNDVPMSQAFFGSSKLLGHVDHISAADILEFTSL